MSSGEVSCTCRPSPPGGTTTCIGGLIAVCADGGTGTCDGKCVPVDPNLGSMEYTAALLSEVIRANLSAGDLEDDAEKFAVIVNKLLESSHNEKAVNFKINGETYHASVGLTDVARKKLGEAVLTLANTRQPEYRTR